MAQVNLKQIAERAGVSLATASRVLSGSDYPVKEEMRARVLQVAEELDYVPNANARGLLSGRSRTVGVIVGDVADPFFSGMVGGIHEVADKAGYMVTVVNTYRQPGKELDTIRRLRAQRVDIMIIAASGLVDDAHSQAVERSLQGFVDAGNAAVLIGHHEVSDALQVSRVRVDHRAAARDLAQYLHDGGHRDVVLIAGGPKLWSLEDRVQGFREVFGDGLSVVEADATRDAGFEVAGTVLADHPAATVVACSADQLAFGVLARFRADGVDVPGRVSVTGFNDIAPAQDMVPALTTMHLPLDEMGRLAMQVGLKALDGQREELEVTAQACLRESAAPVF